MISPPPISPAGVSAERAEQLCRARWSGSKVLDEREPRFLARSAGRLDYPVREAPIVILRKLRRTPSSSGREPWWRGGSWRSAPKMRSNRAGPAQGSGSPVADQGDHVRAGNGVLAKVGSLMRVAQAGDKQRETLERDLHDGLQQRLVAARIRLAIAAELPSGDARLPGALSVLGQDLDEAIDELREVAFGIHPTVLTDHGLVTALQHVGRAAWLPVAVTSTGLTRQPPSWNWRSTTAAARRSRTRPNTAAPR
jgi:signal transduction histidine kinase